MTRRTALNLLAGSATTALAAGQSPAAPAGRWVLQYFYDKDDESFHLSDLSFGSPQFGMAVGYVSERGGRTKRRALVTRDSGGRWEEADLPDNARSVFFLNDSLGWLVGEKGIWRTQEGGREWKRIKKDDNLLRVYFRDATRGWAMGGEKTFLQTTDGGQNWTEVPEAEKVETNPDYTSFHWMEWAGPEIGIVMGASVPPRRGREDEKPAWVDPMAAAVRRQWPATTIAMETQDGGKTWRSQTVPAFGTTTRVRVAVDGYSVILVRFFETFEYPSEVYLTKPKSAELSRIFRQKNRVVTDLCWMNPAKILLAAIEPPGRLHQLPIPGKLRMLTTTNMVDWTEMKVDYRANGTSAVLARVDERNVWVGTDTGQILRYVE